MIPRLELSEASWAIYEWLKALPVCPICGKPAMDYITIADSPEGKVLYRACVKCAKDRKVEFDTAVTDALVKEE